MPKYVIEREMPGVGDRSAGQLRGTEASSCTAIAEMVPQIQWVQSDVTGDTISCVSIAPDGETVHEHARTGGLPANRIAEVRTMIDPITAEG